MEYYPLTPVIRPRTGLARHDGLVSAIYHLHEFLAWRVTKPGFEQLSPLPIHVWLNGITLDITSLELPHFDIQLFPGQHASMVLAEKTRHREANK